MSPFSFQRARQQHACHTIVSLRLHWDSLGACFVSLYCITCINLSMFHWISCAITNFLYNCHAWMNKGSTMLMTCEMPLKVWSVFGFLRLLRLRKTLWYTVMYFMFIFASFSNDFFTNVCMIILATRQKKYRESKFLIKLRKTI